MDRPPELDKNAVYILLAIGAVIGGIAAKLPKLPWWLVVVFAVLGGLAGYAAFATHSIGDFLLGAGAGVLGTYLFASAIEVAKKYLAKRAGVDHTKDDSTDG